MAHECFSCGGECYCSGDIDDSIISLTPLKCKSCGCEDWNYSAPVITANCSKCNQKDEIVEVFLEGESHGNYCYNCCEKEGFCYGCGDFSAGTEKFDFSKMGAYCDNCQEQIRDSYD